MDEYNESILLPVGGSDNGVEEELLNDSVLEGSDRGSDRGSGPLNTSGVLGEEEPEAGQQQLGPPVIPPRTGGLAARVKELEAEVLSHRASNEELAGEVEILKSHVRDCGREIQDLRRRVRGAQDELAQERGRTRGQQQRDTEDARRLLESLRASPGDLARLEPGEVRRRKLKIVESSYYTIVCLPCPPTTTTTASSSKKVAAKLELLARQHAQASEDLAACRRENGEAFRKIDGYRRMQASYEELQEAHLQQGAVLQRYQCE